MKAKTENNAESQQEGSPNSAAHAKLFGLNKASVIRKKSVNNESKLVPSVFNRTVEEVVKFALRTTSNGRSSLSIYLVFHFLSIFL